MTSAVREQVRRREEAKAQRVGSAHLSVRIRDELHARIVRAARDCGASSLNGFVEAALEVACNEVEGE